MMIFCLSTRLISIYLPNWRNFKPTFINLVAKFHGIQQSMNLSHDPPRPCTLLLLPNAMIWKRPVKVEGCPTCASSFFLNHYKLDQPPWLLFNFDRSPVLKNASADWKFGVILDSVGLRQHSPNKTKVIKFYKKQFLKLIPFKIL